MASSALGAATNIATNNIYNGYYAKASEVLQQVVGSAERNSAQSEMYARDLRSWQAEQNEKAMQFNAAEAAKNRDWQEYMSNTAHQREVRDLQAAGLNPVLSASGGNGAAVTSGATASGVTSSGAKGEVDQGLTSGLVQFLTSMINAQTHLQSSNISALNNLAVADKYNKMSELVAQIGAETSRYMSDQSAAVSKYMSDQSAAASKYAADRGYAASTSAAAMSAAASRYASDTSRYISSTSNPVAIISDLFKGMDYRGNDRSVWYNTGKFYGDQIRRIFPNAAR